MNDDEKAKIRQIASLCADLLADVPGVQTVTVPPIPTTPAPGEYTATDISPRPFPAGYIFLSKDLHGADYLQGRCWWLLEEMASAASTNITVLQGCPLTVLFAGSPAHRPCNEQGGGMMADCKYPVINGGLDVVKMRAMIDRFLNICCALTPGKEYLDITNESEIRIGSDVFALVGGKYISGGVVNRHIQIDDAFHHRFDDPLYPHFHLMWNVTA